MKNTHADISGDQLIADFKVVVADAEALIKATANQGDEMLVEIRTRAEESLKVAKARMVDMQKTAAFKTQEAAKAADVYVHANPWQAIGIAAGIGLVAGFLSCRR